MLTLEALNQIHEVNELYREINPDNVNKLYEQLMVGQRIKMIDGTTKIEVQISEIIGKLIQVIDKQGFTHLAECIGADKEGEPVLSTLVSVQSKRSMGYNPSLQNKMLWV